MYRRFARVSTSPTDKGKAEIDAFHPLYGLQYLTRKQVTEFMTGPDRTQWLQMEKGKVRFLFRVGDCFCLWLCPKWAAMLITPTACEARMVFVVK